MRKHKAKGPKKLRREQRRQDRKAERGPTHILTGDGNLRTIDSPDEFMEIERRNRQAADRATKPWQAEVALGDIVKFSYWGEECIGRVVARYDDEPHLRLYRAVEMLTPQVFPVGTVRDIHLSVVAAVLSPDRFSLTTDTRTAGGTEDHVVNIQAGPGMFPWLLSALDQVGHPGGQTHLLRFVHRVVGGGRWKSIRMPLVVDGTACSLPVGSAVDDCIHWVDGQRIAKVEGGYRWESTTVWDGAIAHNFVADFDALGRLTGGFVNCFGLGRLPIDAAYVNEYAESVFERKSWAIER